MRTFLTILVTASVLWSCSAIESQDRSGEKEQASEEEPAGDPSQCTEPKPNDGCNSCRCEGGAWACTEKACKPATEPCEWTLAESQPEQAHGTCKYSELEVSPVTIDLPDGAKPAETTLVVRIDDTKKVFEAFTYDAALHQLKVEAPDHVGKALTVNVDYTVLAGDGDGASCAEDTAALNAFVKAIGAKDKACATSADCVAFGFNPRATCGGPAFTSKTTFAAHEAEHAAIIEKIKASCPMPQAQCAAAFPSIPTCVEATKTCGGEI